MANTETTVVTYTNCKVTAHNIDRSIRLECSAVRPENTTSIQTLSIVIVRLYLLMVVERQEERFLLVVGALHLQ